MYKKIIFLFCMGALANVSLATPPPPQEGVRYVAPGCPSACDGLTWATAYDAIDDALADFSGVGGTIYLSAGDFTVSSGDVVIAGVPVSIIGAGMEVTKIILDTDANDSTQDVAIVIRDQEDQNNTLATAGGSGSVIRDLKIEVVENGDERGAGAIEVDGAEFVVIDNVWIDGFGGSSTVRNDSLRVVTTDDDSDDTDDYADYPVSPFAIKVHTSLASDHGDFDFADWVKVNNTKITNSYRGLILLGGSNGYVENTVIENTGPGAAVYIRRKRSNSGAHWGFLNSQFIGKVSGGTPEDANALVYMNYPADWSNPNTNGQFVNTVTDLTGDGDTKHFYVKSGQNQWLNHVFIDGAVEMEFAGGVSSNIVGQNISSPATVMENIGSNKVWQDNDLDGDLDAGDSNDDNDSEDDGSDNCQFVANNDQTDSDGDLLGDACDPDDDNDGFRDLDEDSLGTDTLNPFDPVSASIGGLAIQGVDWVGHPSGAAESTVWNPVDGSLIITAPADPDAIDWQQTDQSYMVLNAAGVDAFLFGTVITLSDGVSLSVGHHESDLSGDHVCVLTSTPEVWCGYGNVLDPDDTSAREEITGLTNPSDIAVGAGFACAIVYDSTDDRDEVTCWDYSGINNVPTPSLLPGTEALAIAAGHDHVCAITSLIDGIANGVQCWGDNTYDQLGLDTSPADDYVDGVNAPLSIDAGDNHTCVINGHYDGEPEVVCWGAGAENYPDDAILGDLADLSIAKPVSISSTGDSNCVVLAGLNSVDDGLVCWSIDTDGDGVGNNIDAFPTNIAASVDTDADGDPDDWNAGCDATCQSGSGLALDTDDDNDTVVDGSDNCPLVDNISQADVESDSVGDLCDSDDDNDTVTDTTDEASGDGFTLDGTASGESLTPASSGDVLSFFTVKGLAGNDTITTLGGNDFIEGGADNDTIDCGSGNDTLVFESAGSGITFNLSLTSAQVTGGAGTDTLATTNCENILGSDYGDTLTGNSAANILLGENGSDSLFSSQGNDEVDGGAGDDTIAAGSDNDTIRGGTGIDQMRGGASGDGPTSGTVGQDTFSFDDGDSGIGANRDIIQDFHTYAFTSTDYDVIDLLDIDANDSNGTDQAFSSFIGNCAALPAAPFYGGSPGEACFRSGTNSLLFNTDSDTAEEIEIKLSGISSFDATDWSYCVIP